MKAKTKHSFIAMVAFALLLAGCNGGDEESAEETPEATPTTEEATPEATTTAGSPAAAGGGTFRVTLAAESEVPQAGDREMSGSGSVRIDPASGEVCPDLEINKPEGTAIRAAHIHRGAAGANGPIVVPFEADADGVDDKCVTAEQSLVSEIQQAPEGFYVNVHTERFPNGAIRGQLSR